MSQSRPLFPDNFNLAESEKILKENARESSQITEAVQYVQRCMKFYLGKNLQYFVVDLKKYAPLVRLAVMMELMTNFKYVGKPVAVQPDPILAIFGSSFASQLPTYKVSVVRELHENDSKYIIALTEAFGTAMNGIPWSGK